MASLPFRLARGRDADNVAGQTTVRQARLGVLRGRDYPSGGLGLVLVILLVLLLLGRL